MTIFVNRSIPLSQESRDAWRNAGATVLSRRTHRIRQQLATAVEDGTDVFLNLGIGMRPEWDCTVYNEPESVRAIITPAALRRTMPDLIPPQPELHEAFWFKGPGQHGMNKEFHPDGIVGFRPNPIHRAGWDTQKHIAGTEYRVITVGNVIVQAHRKSIRIQINNTNHFDWEWVGVGGIKNNGIIPLVKRAVALVPNGERTVFGWDIIVGVEGPVIIETNSSMGVNDATARRIVEQIRRANGT